MDLLRKSRIALTICSFYVLSIPVCGMFVIGLWMLLNYSLVNFFVFGIPWVIIWGNFAYECCITTYFFPGYFFIICYHLKLRLNSIRNRIQILLKNETRCTLKVRIFTIKRFLTEHNVLCQQIDGYNKYWGKYLTLNYSVILSVICILSFVVCISWEVKWFLRIEYSIILSAHILLLTIETYSASSVSYLNHMLYLDLLSVSAKDRYLIFTKLKVI